MESTQVHSPGGDASTGGESMSSDTHFLPIAPPFQQRIALPHSHNQQMGFPAVGGHDQAAATEAASSWSCRAWDQACAGGLEAGGDLPGGRTEWEVKTHLWDWAIGEEEGEAGGLHVREPSHTALQSGSNKSSIFSHSSGIPGVAATGKGGHGKICSSEHYRSGGEKNSHREFSLGQDMNSSWDLLHTVAMHRIEPCQRTALEKQRNESLERSDQHFVEQTSLTPGDGLKAAGFFSLGGSAAVKIENPEKFEEKETCSNGGTDSGGDLIGLKLGKRTYFGDTATVSAGKSAGAPVGVSPIPRCPSSGRRRGAAASHIPRCQVEGCKVDLSTAKEYHKRHKVCAPHSKAPKVVVASTEQRFCQQCSKFHGLSAFDEGKRSCRRRLAGHNERRRKPQPDALALASGGTSLLGRLPGLNFVGDHYHVHGLEGPHSLWQQLHPTAAPGHNDFNGRLGYFPGGYSRFGNLSSHGASLQSMLELPATADSFLPSLPKPAADRLIMILPQHPSPLASSLNGNQINQIQQRYGPIDSALSLSPSSGTRCIGLEASVQASRGLSTISDSGCALSLLSSQPWGSLTPSLSFDLSSRPPMLETLSGNAAAFSQQIPHRDSPGVHDEYVGLTDEVIFAQPLSQSGAIPAMSPSAFQGTPQVPFGMSSDFHTLALPHGHDDRSLHSFGSHPRPTIDLMESPSSHLHHSCLGQVQTANQDFLEFQSSKPLDLAMYDAQTML